MRKGYIIGIANAVKRIFRAHRETLFSDEARNKYNTTDFNTLMKATSLLDIDILYSR